MQTSENYIDEIFEFKGLWDIPSKCGIKRISKNGNPIVIVTELYLDNPGSSITSVAPSLAMQISEKFGYTPSQLTYIECNPNMNSKLSFYDEDYFLVTFDIVDPEFKNPRWKKLTKQEFTEIINN
jgi:hypothetical protein